MIWDDDTAFVEGVDSGRASKAHGRRARDNGGGSFSLEEGSV